MYISSIRNAREHIKSICVPILLAVFICHTPTVYTHQGSHASSFSPGIPAQHDHDEHETDKHKDYEKQVLLGDEEEGAGYDNLSREDKINRLRAIAKKVDSNHNYVISKEELNKWIQENHMKYLLKNSREYVGDIDVNNDSLVSFKEYELSHFIPGTPGMPKDYRNTTRYKHSERRFNHADLNKDGQLSVHEFLYFINPEEGKHMRASLVLETINNMDLDGDGALNIKDFIGEGIVDIKNGDEFVEKVKEFKSFDKNVDGLLIEDEVRDWMYPEGYNPAKHEVEHIFSHGDKDKDGKMTYEEFSSIPEHLEQSRGTGYGDLFREHKEEL